VQNDISNCEIIIKRLSTASHHVTSVLENCRVCLGVLNNALIKDYEQKEEKEKSRAAQPVAVSDFRIVEQKFQHTMWLEWTREEQIKNSIATDKDSAISGKVSIPHFCFLKLKPN
jgi:hypothetical protein